MLRGADGRTRQPASTKSAAVIIAEVYVLISPTSTDLPLRRLDDRWAGLIDEAQLALLTGKHVLHTDPNPHNILIAEHARIVDWAWPTLGAAWVDPGCAALWLIAEGHTPPAAEAWATQIPSWATASLQQIDAFTAANRRLWKQIAHDDPQPWKPRLHSAAQAWAKHRRI